MAFTIIDTSGPIISATISGELGKSEVTKCPGRRRRRYAALRQDQRAVHSR